MLRLILAATPKGEIGYKQTIPWTLPGDLPRFAAMTMGQTVIMGTKTYHSLSPTPGEAPLKDRDCIVVGCTHYGRLSSPRTYTALSVPEALLIASELGSTDTFVIGGAGLYNELWEMADVIDLTLVHQTADRYDTRVDMDFSGFTLSTPPVPVYHLVDGLPIPSHTYLTYVRR